MGALAVHVQLIEIQATISRHGSNTIMTRNAVLLVCFAVCVGLALRVHLGHTGVVTDRMLVTAEETLPFLVPNENLKQSAVYPTLDDIRWLRQ